MVQQELIVLSISLATDSHYLNHREKVDSELHHVEDFYFGDNELRGPVWELSVDELALSLATHHAREPWLIFEEEVCSHGCHRIE